MPRLLSSPKESTTQHELRPDSPDFFGCHQFFIVFGSFWKYHGDQIQLRWIQKRLAYWKGSSGKIQSGLIITLILIGFSFSIWTLETSKRMGKKRSLKSVPTDVPFMATNATLFTSKRIRMALNATWWTKPQSVEPLDTARTKMLFITSKRYKSSLPLKVCKWQLELFSPL